MRIIDVNTNRAAEGIRVVEEICRFVLEDNRSALALKRMRGELAKIAKKIEISASERLLVNRAAERDIGKEFYTHSEKKRDGLTSIFQANCKRAQEALRCLEEFSKLIGPEYGKRFKGLRFGLYDWEKKIAPEILKNEKLDFEVYVVTDPQFNHLAALRKVVAKGGKIIQLRDKRMSKNDYFKLAKKFSAITRRARIVFILNDYWNMVEEVGADGVHLGQEDLAGIELKSIRRKIGKEKIIGLSTHSFQQAKKAERLGADYISVGPIFRTPSKALNKPVGLNLLKRVIRSVKIPVVAIGGINRSNVKAVNRLGCRRVAVIRAADEMLSLN